MTGRVGMTKGRGGELGDTFTLCLVNAMPLKVIADEDRVIGLPEVEERTIPCTENPVIRKGEGRWTEPDLTDRSSMLEVTSNCVYPL